MAKHTCHWPGCGAPVPPRMWGCKAHWQQLPKPIRDRIWAAYVPGQEITKTPSEAYLAAARAAREWILENHGPARVVVVLKSRRAGLTTEQHRSECEARHWIREGYFNAARVDELMDRIRKRRGSEAAEALREEMRRQWLRRSEWLARETPVDADSP